MLLAINKNVNFLCPRMRTRIFCKFPIRTGSAFSISVEYEKEDENFPSQIRTGSEFSLIFEYDNEDENFPLQIITESEFSMSVAGKMGMRMFYVSV